MNLHRIAGQNLASLEDEFEILLDKGPLAQLGLFAIAGPTGAGKSTVLDALCLALYGDTPRLHGRGGVEVGDGADIYRTHDARSLVRRGAAVAWAEVEFTGVNDVRYLARWSVRRRPRVGGLEDPSVTLHRVGSSTTEGGKKGETLARIIEVVGLDFDAFVRSVLLAQGDFARLLHATADKRGEALEWITHSELYSDLSRITYQRANAVEAGLREELAALRGIVRMTDEARSAVSDRLSALGEGRPASAALIRRLQAARAWHEGKTALGDELANFENTEAAATESLAALAGVRGELDVAERAAKVAVPLAAAEQAGAALQRHAVATIEFEGAQVRAADAVAPANDALAEANTYLVAHLAAQADGVAPLREARRLDALVEAAGAGHLAAVDKFREAGIGLAKAQTGLVRARELAAAAAQRLSGLDVWLAENASLVALAPGWSGTGPLLTDWAGTLGTAESEAAAAAKVHASAVAQATLAQAASAPAQAATLAAERARRERDAALHPQEAALAASLTAEAGQLQTRRQTLVAAEALHQEMAALQRRLQDAETARTSAATAGRAAGERQADAAALLVGIDARLDEAARQLRALEARQDLAAHRAALKPGEECPLCGAADHSIPADARFDEAVAESRARLSELRADRDATTRAISGEAARIDAAEEAERIGVADIQRATAEREALAAKHGAPASAEALAATRAHLAAAEVAHEAAVVAQRKRAADYRRLDEAADDARVAADAATITLQTAQEHANTLTADHRVRAERTAELVERAAGLAQRLATQLGNVPDWSTRYRSQGARSTLGAAVVEAGSRFQERAEVDQAATAGETAVAIARSELLTASAHQAREAGHVQSAAEALATLQTQRAAALASADADAFELSLAGPVETARLQFNHLGQRLTAARTAAAEAGAVLDAHVRAHPALQDAESAAVTALTAALAVAGLAVEEARASVARGEAWREQSQRRWDQAVAARARATLLVEDTRRRLSALEDAPPAGAEKDSAALAEQLVSAEADHAKLLVAIGTAEATLAADQHCRDEYQRRDEALGDARADAEAWSELKATIGDAAGKTLRSFAQALTLARLLEEANAVLEELAPRYQLQSLVRSPLDLQVIDRHRANEARGVKTLSGGETFLLSLAMALGLSNLASRRQPVNCLFIDEGFGALDPHALDQALSMLESLQQRGRIIGIISHVPGLAERVGARVDIVPTGLGTSRVVVVAG